MTGKEIIKCLEKCGWKILRINGSHYRMGKDELRTTVPVHGTRDIGKGLLAEIERQTGEKTKMNVLYPADIIFDMEDQRYLVKFPDFSEAITEGENEEEALFNASEVLTLTIEARLEEDLALPKPSFCQKEQVLISPSARSQAALLIRWAKLEGDHSTAEIARSLNTSWPAISRLESPKHWPSLRQLEKVAHVLGQQLIISMEPLPRRH